MVCNIFCTKRFGVNMNYIDQGILGTNDFVLGVVGYALFLVVTPKSNKFGARVYCVAQLRVTQQSF